jgi:hypothetical protein
MSADTDFWNRQRRISYFWLREELEADNTFVDESLKLLRHLNPGSTYTRATSASALLEYWVVERELTVFERGNPVTDVAAVVLYPDEKGDTTAADNTVEQGWRIDHAEFLALLARYRVTVPSFLNCDAPPTDDAKINVTVWTSERRKELREEHAHLVAKHHKSPTRELARKYGVSESRIRDLKSEHASTSTMWKGLGGK